MTAGAAGSRKIIKESAARILRAAAAGTTKNMAAGATGKRKLMKAAVSRTRE